MNMNNEPHLVQNYYHDLDPSRVEEFTLTMTLNAQVFPLERTHFFHQNGPTRPTFKDLFLFANYLCDIPVGAPVVLANLDISFSPSFTKQISRLSRSQVWAISQGDDKRGDSQACWCWRHPLLVPPDCDIPFGIGGSDNAIAERLARVGYTVLNPCLSIELRHHHKGEHTWMKEERAQKPYISVSPCKLEGESK